MFQVWISSANLNDLKSHKSEKHSPITYSCESCDFDTAHEYQLEKHKRTKHSVDFPCDFCEFQAMNTSDLANHRRTKHVPEFPCENCTYKANGKADLNRHKRGMHQDKFRQGSVYFNRSRQNYKKNESLSKPRQQENEGATTWWNKCRKSANTSNVL